MKTIVALGQTDLTVQNWSFSKTTVGIAITQDIAVTDPNKLHIENKK